VVGQVRANRLIVGYDEDPVLAQFVGRPDPGQHEQLRAADCPGAEDDLGLRAYGFVGPLGANGDPGGSPALDEDARHVHPGANREVRASGAYSRWQVCVSGRAASAARLCHLVEADALLDRPVEVVVLRSAPADGRLDEGLAVR
jgi:hypothetical protein